MAFTLDGPPETSEETCSTCGSAFRLILHFILKDDHTYSIAKSQLHIHGSKPETWINAVFGSFSEDKYDDHVTFGCRVGLFTEDREPAAGLIDAAEISGDSSVWGARLTRDQALDHGLLRAFWEVTDWLIFEDPQIHSHLYGHTFERPPL
ncbi:hypothetical protein ACX80W_04405 [Arthrobacter sp. TMN-37]